MSSNISEIAQKMSVHDILNQKNWTIGFTQKVLESKTRYLVEPRNETRKKDKVTIARQLFQHKSLKNKLLIVDQKEVEYMITHKYKNFNLINRKLSNEKIISLMIFYVMKKKNLNYNIENYKVFKEMGLKKIHYENFVTRLCCIKDKNTPIRSVDKYF